MAKYESPCQVLGLFAGAILVSCGVIYILTLEANKRYGDVSGRSFEAPEVSGTIDLMFMSANITELSYYLDYFHQSCWFQFLSYIHLWFYPTFQHFGYILFKSSVCS